MVRSGLTAKQAKVLIDKVFGVIASCKKLPIQLQPNFALNSPINL